MKRVVLTGSESTGKTELARRLAQHLGAPLVAEFVRAYVEREGRAPEFRDHGPIARGQMAAEDGAIATGAPVVVQDTDLLSTVVYCDHYFGRCPDWIREAARDRRPDLYLLCDVDVPWVADPVRDRGDRRAEMHALFEQAVAGSGAPWILVRGDWEERFIRALEAVRRIP